jgi:hypothetical protein
MIAYVPSTSGRWRREQAEGCTRDVYVCSPCYSLYLYVERERERYIVVSTEFWLLSISPVERENREQRAERHHSRERERQKDM